MFLKNWHLRLVLWPRVTNAWTPPIVYSRNSTALSSVLSSSYVTLTCAAIAGHKYIPIYSIRNMKSGLLCMGWIKQTSILPVQFWWMTIEMEVKTIKVTYRSHTLLDVRDVIINAQINCGWADLCTSTFQYCMCGKCFITDTRWRSVFLWEIAMVSGVYIHMGINTIHWWCRAAFRSPHSTNSGRFY